MTQRGRKIIDREEVIADQGVVATKHPLESEAGIAILKAGGNAVDAAVAIGFMSVVVEPWMVTLGGVGFMQFHDSASGNTWTVDYLGRVPKAGRPDMFPWREAPGNALSTYEVEGDANVTGYQSATVPGLPAGLCEAHRRWGKLPLQAVMEPAIDRASEGTPSDPDLVNHVATEVHNIPRFPATASVFLPDGRVPEKGTPVKQPDLAGTLRRIAKDGPAAFYTGEIAEAIEGDMRANGGLVTREDLRDFAPIVNPSLAVNYRGTEIRMGACPNGFWTGAQILNILRHFDQAAAGHNSAAALHAYIEAARHALADRYYYLTDPDFEPVPLEGMLSPEYAKQLAALVAPDRSAHGEGGDVPAIHFALEAMHNPWEFDRSGQTPKSWSGTSAEPAGAHTTSFAVIDRDRDVVVCTQTTGETFGSKVTTPGTGILWNDMMALFSPRPGTANSIAPWKRTLTSTSPVIALRDGKPWFAAGAPGGRRIMNSVQQVVLNVVDFGMSIQPAISAPRVDVSTENTYYDDRLDPDVVDRLTAMGHKMVAVNEEYNPFGWEFANPTGVMVDGQGRLRGGADPFRLAEARGF